MPYQRSAIEWTNLLKTNDAMSEYVKYIYHSFRKINGYVFTLFGVILAVLALKFGTGATVPLWLAVAILILLCIAIAAFADALGEALSRKVMLPSVRQVSAGNMHGFQYSGDQAVFLIEPSEMFASDVLVSIYSDVEGFEVLIGLGYVIGNTSHGHIQALINEHPEGAHPGIWSKILANDNTVISKLKVKPSAPRLLFDY